MERKYAWHNYTKTDLKKVNDLADGYRSFLDNGKTERECIVQAVAAAQEKGYKNLTDLVKEGTALKAGDKVYYVHMDKSIALFNIGRQDIEEGLNILGAHIDSPRIDVKQNPNTKILIFSSGIPTIMGASRNTNGWLCLWPFMGSLSRKMAARWP